MYEKYRICALTEGRVGEGPLTEALYNPHINIPWVGPPPTNSGILGIYKDPNIITITSCGHYYWVGAQANTYLYNGTYIHSPTPP